jgi:hypothetical protein
MSAFNFFFIFGATAFMNPGDLFMENVIFTTPIQQLHNLIIVLHHHNNCTTTPHMRMDSRVWDPPSCERLLYSCCIGVVNLTFS